MKDKIKKYIKEILTFIVLMTVFANILSLYRSAELNKIQLSLESVTLLDNIKYDLPKNKAIILYFWGSWCPVCKIEAGNIQRVSQKYEVLTIALKSGSDDEINNYLKENNLNFRVINDNNGYLTNKFNISIFPTIIIYDKDKNIVFSDVGYTSTWGLYLRMWWANY
ncbi:MAG: protein disulfide oxidoreductase [Sulfurimonas sp.]|nr:protein disulfide oxidoreductase [Sulfurimonas sp.]